jgi:hypothetical protein
MLRHVGNDIWSHEDHVGLPGGMLMRESRHHRSAGEQRVGRARVSAIFTTTRLTSAGSLEGARLRRSSR